MSEQNTAWDRLLGLIDTAKAADLRTSPATAIADAIRESVVNAPSLRNCLYPGCLREFDMAARMNGRKPARPSWSGDGWHQVTRGPAPGSLCPDHVGIVTQHLPRTVDLPNGRWMVACACDWTSSPQTYGGLLRPLWQEHLLLAAGELTAPVTLAETPARLPLADHTEDSLRELYEALEDTEQDRAETRDAAQAMYKSWDWHRNTLAGVSRAVVSVCNMMRVASSHYERDWAADRHDAYLWAVLIGWDDDALNEIAAKHRWNEHRVKYVREMRALLAPLTDPQTEDGKATS
ncbi:MULTISPECIES: hypothetical protein [unclassified Streptomyces]|uniref:hypothetical protein n=1 Tax=unclassified Streptomyces TaxID=2593676 RepID=UPI001F419881|nr:MULTISPECIES: hypothetical protein [unclassified Streptomyces]MCF0086680.1 hypothetical protein [Streptomyces sp. MH192]MCF0098834.1 hypothetical protein [Streptomyces sp. MH191]